MLDGRCPNAIITFLDCIKGCGIVGVATVAGMDDDAVLVFQEKCCRNNATSCYQASVVCVCCLSPALHQNGYHLAEGFVGLPGLDGFWGASRRCRRRAALRGSRCFKLSVMCPDRAAVDKQIMAESRGRPSNQLKPGTGTRGSWNNSQDIDCVRVCRLGKSHKHDAKLSQAAVVSLLQEWAHFPAG